MTERDQGPSEYDFYRLIEGAQMGLPHSPVPRSYRVRLEWGDGTRHDAILTVTPVAAAQGDAP